MDEVFDRYFKQGQKLGYSAETLPKYIDQCFERDQREKERDKEREEKERDKEREREKEERLTKLKLDAEVEVARLNVESERGKMQQDQNERQSTSHGVGPRPSNFPKLPIFKESIDSIDAFLYRFESHANALKWPKDSWSVLLSAVLQGQALDLYHGLSVSGSVQYDVLKKCLMTKFQCNAEGFREKFRACRPETSESFQSYGTRLSHLLERWVDMSEIEKTYDALFDLVLSEQLLVSVSKDLAVFLRERNLKASKDMLEHAESYRLAHPNKNLARRTEQSIAMFAVPSGEGQSGTGEHSWKNTTSFRGGNNNQNRGFPQANRTRGQGARGGQFNTPRGQLRGQLRGTPQTRPNVDDKQCYNCGGYGHFARNCCSTNYRQKLDVTTGNKDRHVQNGHTAILCSAVTDGDLEDLDLSDGCVNGFQVVIMKDDGATTAGVRRDLVLDDQYTGEKQLVRGFGGQIDEYAVARVQVDSDYFTGELDCCVIDNPVVDVIIGKIKGKTVPTRKFGPGTTTPGLIGDLRQATTAVTRAQSRRDQGNPESLVVPIPKLSVSHNDLCDMQKADNSLQPLFQLADSQEKKISGGNSFLYVFSNKMLVRHFFRGSRDCSGTSVEQIVVPEPLRDTVLSTAHDGLLAGHCGVRRTLSRIQSRFFWPGAAGTVRKYCQSCDICQKC